MIQPPEQPKVVLAKQAEIPKLALSGTPLAPLGEGISGILSTIAKGLPELPEGALAGLTGNPLVAPREFIKGIEAALPKEFPKLPEFPEALGSSPNKGEGRGRIAVQEVKRPEAERFGGITLLRTS